MSHNRNNIIVHNFNEIIPKRGPRGHRGKKGDRGVDGSQGPAGPAGSQGETGSPGPTGSGGNITVEALRIGTIVPAIQVSGSDSTQAIINGAMITPGASGVTGSSYTDSYVPQNVLINNDQAWLSAIDSNNPEWVEYDFGSPRLFTGIYAVCSNGRFGAGNKIQASNDNVTWTDIHIFDDNWTYDSLNNTQIYTNYINDINTYRYVRLYSEPSPYCMYYYIQYIGLQ